MLALPQSDPTLDARRRRVMERLRAETRAAHERIEGAVDVMRPDLTVDRYRHVLERFLGFIGPWERAAVPAARGDAVVEAELRRRSRAGLLRDDLRHLGLTDPQVDALPSCRTLPRLESLPNLLGSMYVLEGSTLGGQVISRHLELGLHLAGGRGYSFFRGHGPQTGAMWQDFQWLLASRTTERDDASVAAAANETFDLFHDWLTGRAQLP